MIKTSEPGQKFYIALSQVPPAATTIENLITFQRGLRKALPQIDQVSHLFGYHGSQPHYCIRLSAIKDGHVAHKFIGNWVASSTLNVSPNAISGEVVRAQFYSIKRGLTISYIADLLFQVSLLLERQIGRPISTTFLLGDEQKGEKNELLVWCPGHLEPGVVIHHLDMCCVYGALLSPIIDWSKKRGSLFYLGPFSG